VYGFVNQTKWKANDAGLGRYQLGEGVIWTAGRLCWVDIEGRSLHSARPADAQVESLPFEGPVTMVHPAVDGSLVVACGSQLYQVNSDLTEARLLSEVEPLNPERRCNDGGVDPFGRLWIGVMSCAAAAGEGVLYRLDPKNLKPQPMLDGLTIPNGIGWSRDGRSLFFVDSFERAVFAFDFDPLTGKLSEQRTVVRVPETMGLPDGFAVDKEDRLWIAHWGDGCVRCWDPRRGTVEETIQTGASQVTSCAFSGDIPGELWITSAWDGLESRDRPEAEHGAIFRCRVEAAPGPLYRASLPSDLLRT